MSSVPVVTADASRNLALLQGCPSILDTALWYRSHFKVGNWTLGQAAQQAMQRLYDIGSNFDLIHTDSIFGDPVLHLRSPYSLQGSPTAQNADGPHGSAVEYTFQVTNTGTITDTIVFDLLGGSWPVILPQPVTVPQGETVDVTFWVSIPTDACDTWVDFFTIRSTSQPNRSQVAQAQLTTNAYDYGVRLSAESVAQAARAGELVTYNLSVPNNGAYADKISITLEGNRWEIISLPDAIPILYSGESTELTVQVQVPGDADLGDYDRVIEN